MVHNGVSDLPGGRVMDDMKMKTGIELLKEALDPRPCKSNELYDLEPIEKSACDYVAHEDQEVSDALETWAKLSVRGRSAAFDEALCDRLEILLSKSIYRFQDEAPSLSYHDEHERLESIG